MLTSLSLTNFKSWREIREMRFAPITGLFGTNSSGKTSILQLLLMLKQTIESSDRAQVLNFGNERSHVRLGTFKDVLRGHDMSQELTFSIDWTRATDLELFQDVSGRNIKFAAEITTSEGGSPQVQRMSYGFEG